MPGSISQIFLTFLRLGSLGFGGPIALIALMEREFVHTRKWIDDRDFQKAYLFCKLLPGPVAFQMALWLGRQFRGFGGGLAAGFGFLLPGFALIVALSAMYTQVRSWAFFPPLVMGLRAAALAVIAESIYRLMLPYRRSYAQWGYILAGFLAMLWLPEWEPVIIICGGIAALMGRPRATAHSMLWPLFWIHFKAGFLVFGTGLAVLPVLQSQVVDRFHWLPVETFLDAVAFGQVTPGPITITSAFIGHQVAGLTGSIVATAGMYGPGLILVLGLIPILDRRMSASRFLERFQIGALPTVIGCLAAASVQLGVQTVSGTASVICLVLALGLGVARVAVPWIFLVTTALSFALMYLGQR